jgi:adhesin/invasin
MLTQPGRRARHASLTVVMVLSTILASSCDKVPLLAPTGTVITLFPAATTVPVDGNVEITATVIENGVAQAPASTGTGTTGTGTTGTGTTGTGTTSTSTAGSGTPVQNGTLVSFTTTIGRIEPSEARTNNGQVKVRFIPGGQSGSATITAYSGGASGKIENLLVGSAGVDHVILSATPQTLGASGGASVISARVESATGQPVTSVPVSFSADVGTLSAASANTDASGVASVTLTTTAKATVTANVAGKTATVAVALNPRTGVTITAPTTSIAAGQPASFTFAVATTANIRDVRVNWGDGQSQALGALAGSTTASHTYTEAATYTVQATATDTSGFSETVSSSITILPAQPPTVQVTPSNLSPGLNETIIVRVQVSGNTSSIIRYDWTFGPGASLGPTSTTSAQLPVSWSTIGSKVIAVTAIQATGPSGDGLASVTVRQ